MVPVTALGSAEQFLSSWANDVLVADAAPPVAVAVAAAKDELSSATLPPAVLALLASTPVPAARPITAAERRATMTQSTKTIVAQPHIVPLVFFPPSDVAWAGPPAAAFWGLGDVGSSWLPL